MATFACFPTLLSPISKNQLHFCRHLTDNYSQMQVHPLVHKIFSKVYRQVYFRGYFYPVVHIPIKKVYRWVYKSRRGSSGRQKRGRSRKPSRRSTYSLITLHASTRRSGFQAALAGLVDGRQQAARPVTLS